MKKKLFSLLFIMIGMLGIMNVEAASTTIGDTSVEKSIPVTRTVNGVNSSVSNTFFYRIVPSDGNPADVTGLPAIDITDEDGVPYSFMIEFNDVTPIETIDGGTCASITEDIDLSSLTFTKVGTYYFTIFEVLTEDMYRYPVDRLHEFTFPVFVENELDSNTGIPTGNLIATLIPASIIDGSETKDNINFTNNAYSYITLEKKVRGDMADINKYFKFKITDVNSYSSATFSIIGQDSDVTYNGENIHTSNEFKLGRDNYVYLKPGQSITIGIDDGGETAGFYQIPSGIEFSIEEEDATDYKTYINQSNNDSKEISFNLSNVSENNSITYENVKESSSLTGVLVNSIPFIVLFGVSIVGIILVRKKVRV